jgi:predicted transglutaminase-like cysteine proteinase
MPKTIFLLSILLLSSSLVVAGVLDFSPGLLSYVASKWGGDAPDRLQIWRDSVLERVHERHVNKVSKSTLAPDDLQIINAMWNKIPYLTDIKHWQVDDYWATPVEMLGSNGGDCEDYAIGKYFSLKELGIPVEKLRITYVRALKINEPHMVLAYYPTPDADPYILDSLTGKIALASERADLEPVYSFNDEDLWAAGSSNFKGKSSQIRLWRDLLEKMAKERQM